MRVIMDSPSLNDKELQILEGIANESNLKINNMKLTVSDGTLIGLDVDNCGLDVLSSKLLGLKNIKNLSAKNNSISSIPSLKDLPTLSVLWLDGNRLTQIPPDLPNSLQDMNLGRNAIPRISNLEHLDDLRSLDLSDNKITKIGGITGVNLAYLDLSSNKIGKIE